MTTTIRYNHPDRADWADDEPMDAPEHDDTPSRTDSIREKIAEMEGHLPFARRDDGEYTRLLKSIGMYQDLLIETQRRAA